MEQVLSAEHVSQALESLYQAIFSNWPNLKASPPAIIGIRTRGEIIASRFVHRLARQGITIEHGVLDVTFYRDDLSRRRGAPLVRATEIDFDINDKIVLLVDDVLHTGRSVRAAMDALMDYGRPKAIRLAVLIDRDGREMPIAAEYVGKRLDVSDDMRVQVQLVEADGQDSVFLEPRESKPDSSKRMTLSKATRKASPKATSKVAPKVATKNSGKPTSKRR